MALTRTDFQTLADVRIAEAGVLLANGHWDGTYYLAGYAVECALKACIAKLTLPEEFPDKERAMRSWTHKFDDLVKAAGLEAAHNADMPRGSARWRIWQLVGNWSEASRYARKSKDEAEELYRFITDPTQGILPWIKARW